MTMWIEFKEDGRTVYAQAEEIIVCKRKTGNHEIVAVCAGFLPARLGLSIDEKSAKAKVLRWLDHDTVVLEADLCHGELE